MGVERSTLNVQRSMFNPRFACFHARLPDDVKRGRSRSQVVICQVADRIRKPFVRKMSERYVQRSTFNVQHSTFNIQRSTFNIQRSTSTFNVQHSRVGIEERTRQIADHRRQWIPGVSTGGSDVCTRVGCCCNVSLAQTANSRCALGDARSARRSGNPEIG